MSSAPNLTRIPVRVRTGDGTTRDDGWVHTVDRPFLGRVGEAALIALGGTAVGILLLPIPLVHLFGIIFALTTWWFALGRARTSTVVKDAGGTCPHCGAALTFFVGFGRKRFRLPITTSCANCSRSLTLEPLSTGRPADR